MNDAQRAARLYMGGLGTQEECAAIYGLAKNSVYSAVVTATEARLSTLRAMTQQLVDDIGAIDAVRGAA